MKTILWFAALIAVASADDDRFVKFVEFANKHSKKYVASEVPLRMALIHNRSMMVEKHNAEAAAGLHSYTLEVNHLADLTHEEMKKKLGLVRSKIPKLSAVALPLNLSVAIPSSVDLRTSKCLPPVKDQAGCGSCWAFAATAPIEYQYCKKYGKRVLFSEQQVNSCSSGGCNGGCFEEAWDYLIKVGGQVTAAAYPYTSSNGDTGSCLPKSSPIKAKISSWDYVDPWDDENAIANAVATYGVVTVGLLVNDKWASYKSGIFDDPSCASGNGGHAVAIVGYGTHHATKKQYWIVRNSWSAQYGKKGYILMRRGVRMCAIGSAAVPIVA